MLKKVLSIFILIAILLQTSNRMLIFMGYSVNKGFITEKLCVNKAKPKMHCNGKCHLSKQFQQEDKKEKAPVNAGKEKFEIYSLSFRENTFFLPCAEFRFAPATTVYYESPSPEILQLPQV